VLTDLEINFQRYRCTGHGQNSTYWLYLVTDGLWHATYFKCVASACQVQFHSDPSQDIHPQQHSNRHTLANTHTAFTKAHYHFTTPTFKVKFITCTTELSHHTETEKNNHMTNIWNLKSFLMHLSFYSIVMSSASYEKKTFQHFPNTQNNQPTYFKQVSKQLHISLIIFIPCCADVYRSHFSQPIQLLSMISLINV